MANQKRVLLVDDDPAVSVYLVRVLRMLGHAVDTVETGAEALKRAEAGGLDLMISDLNMPGEPNGVELIRALHEARPECPIVVISGYPTEDRLSSCEDIGVRTFLTKPFELSFIRQVLEEVFTTPAGPGGAESS